ncbi:hypothetical protein ABZV67_09745 [Streptomyces sp. NPDC005065]|uniref:hypothetical protein n=1 Tax=Streptomyces sp. NPDC005065 TaxID=3154461 RepID=UPI0033B72473
MTLFKDPGFDFNGLLALGAADYEQFYPGQPRQMFDNLTSPKDYVKLTAATGAQLHCSPMAPQQHCEVVFDWLQETLPGR